MMFTFLINDLNSLIVYFLRITAITTKFPFLKELNYLIRD